MTKDIVKSLVGESWADIVSDEFQKQYMLELSSYIRLKRSEVTVYPSSENVFTAYKLTPYDEVKVVILGQDPYIKKDEAHGLSFSTLSGRSTPSLRQIHKAVEREFCDGLLLDWDNNLVRWATQGVFLLNTVLTVEAGKSNSHAGKGWETFTMRTIQELNKKDGIVFLLWGAEARKYAPILNNNNNLVLECEHPVAASYQGREWRNDECFNRANNFLRIVDKNPIKWR